jgi:hypothetical protein
LPLQHQAAPVRLSPAPPAPPPIPAPPPAPSDKLRYRAQQPQLFQPIKQGSIPPRLPGLHPRPLDYHGPAATAIDWQTGWQWANKGGD